MCRFHTQTAGSTLQAQQIDNNIIRTTMQATAAILGGTQSLHTNSKDEALSLPTEKSAQIALRTQQILAYETGIPNVADPLAGSYYIEDLTNQIEKKTLNLMSNIDELGGAISAIEINFQQNKIADSAYKYQKSIENNEQVIVGTNKFNTSPSNESHSTFEIDVKSSEEQLARLTNFKKNRNLDIVKDSLYSLSNSINDNTNLVPIIISCIKNHCTLGEICDTMKNVFGEHI
jgi:methylmalonyl-CoA mutase N-terminal domain/subunit